MSDAEQRIQSWHDDPEKHAIIWCWEWSFSAFGQQMPCAACGRPISAWPAVADAAKRNPRFHAVCRPNCMAICLRVCGPLPFLGRMKTNHLPKELERFVKEKEREL